MNWLVKIASFCVILVSSLPVFGQTVNWETDFAFARKQAKQQEKLMLLHFSAKWCRPCKQLETFVFSSERVAKAINESVVPVYVDTDDYPELVKEFSVGEIPMDVIITEAGEVITKRNSPKNADSYIRMIKALPGIENARKQSANVVKKKVENLVAAVKNPNSGDKKNLFAPTRPTHVQPPASKESQQLVAKNEAHARRDRDIVPAMAQEVEESPLTPPPANQPNIAQAGPNRAPGALRVINDRFFAEKTNALQDRVATRNVARDNVRPNQFTARSEAPSVARGMANADGQVRRPMSVQLPDNSFRPQGFQPQAVAATPAIPAIPAGAPRAVEPVNRSQATAQPTPNNLVLQPPMKTEIQQQITPDKQPIARAKINNPFRPTEQPKARDENRTAARILEPDFEKERQLAAMRVQPTKPAMSTMAQVRPRPSFDSNATQPELRERSKNVASLLKPESARMPVAQTAVASAPSQAEQRLNPKPVQQKTALNFDAPNTNTGAVASKATFAPRKRPAIPATAAKAAEKQPTESYVLGGKCPVTLVRDGKWADGDKQFGCVHRGRVYLFTSQENLNSFQKAPESFSPILAGYDPVVFHERGELVDGNEKHGVFMGKSPNHRIVLFESAETRAKFQSAPKKFMATIKMAVNQSDRKLR